jgi:phosphoribosylanthranilate isomerase
VARFTEASYLIKVCAVTSSADAQLVANAGATAIGVILADSSRRVSVEAASEIFDAVAGRLARVAVVRDVDAEEVSRILDALDCEALQVHGGVRAGVAATLRERDVALVEALRVDDLDARSVEADAYLIDGPRPGSGETHSWHGVVSRSWDRPLIVAGGLRAENVTDVLEAVHPWGCDVATGSESSPGVKDAARVASFVRSARHYFESQEERRG